jgi:hypothetical protein
LENISFYLVKLSKEFVLLMNFKGIAF